MLNRYEGRKIFSCENPIDIRMGVDALSAIIYRSIGGNLYDGSLYVFHNKARNKVKIFFWDMNGFMTIYKRLEGGCKFKMKLMRDEMSAITYEDLELLLAGVEPKRVEHTYLEHQA